MNDKDPTFSGPLRAGLIEARSRRDRALEGGASFPAPCGPASLKQLPRLGRADGAPGFPAPCGPASLKRGEIAAAPAGHRTFSGPLRAGLIEADLELVVQAAGRRGFPAPCGPASLKRQNG